MSRYPSRDVERFDQQFAETEGERNERLAAKRKRAQAAADILRHSPVDPSAPFQVGDLLLDPRNLTMPAVECTAISRNYLGWFVSFKSPSGSSGFGPAGMFVSAPRDPAWEDAPQPTLTHATRAEMAHDGPVPEGELAAARAADARQTLVEKALEIGAYIGWLETHAARVDPKFAVSQAQLAGRRLAELSLEFEGETT